jgi:hypothetical protein
MTHSISVDPSIFEIAIDSLQSAIAVPELTFEIGQNQLFGLIETKIENTEISVGNLLLDAFTEYDIPDFPCNQAALVVGLRSGELYRDANRKIRVVLDDRTGFVLNLSKAWSLLRRLF